MRRDDERGGAPLIRGHRTQSSLLRKGTVWKKLVTPRTGLLERSEPVHRVNQAVSCSRPCPVWTDL